MALASAFDALNQRGRILTVWEFDRLVRQSVPPV